MATITSVMQVLEQSENDLIARSEVAAAIRQVAQQKQIILDPVATDAFVSNIFSSANSSNQGSVSRGDLHRALE